MPHDEPTAPIGLAQTPLVRPLCAPFLKNFRAALTIQSQFKGYEFNVAGGRC
ncbi:hypothetical protein K443DRAFT_686520 [Laccaria amethystina LaAM-08-1]|uniref:Uncharacterized protein n=1 Tax=Laccaria amethystina LaAM-08-1 TaxID=1095629 RepID=A0A0C9X2I0_9AGAR|nr:hypothetical protein K443DRAFT_686520 [Laccaria amethystina LaAM-08-1]